MKSIAKTIITTLIIGVLFALWTAGSYYLGRRSMPVIEKTTIDTVIIRQTIRDTILIPKVQYLARTDTVFLQIPGDTVRVMVEVPIERKVYQTDDYRATIEGFRPCLIDMEVYRQTHYITQIHTVKVPDKRRWGLGVQAGYGYIPSQNKLYPYVGIGLQYSLLTW